MNAVTRGNGRVLAKKVRSGQRIWLRCTNRSIFLAEPPVIRTPPTSPLGYLGFVRGHPYKEDGFVVKRKRNQLEKFKKVESPGTQRNYNKNK